MFKHFDRVACSDRNESSLCTKIIPNVTCPQCLKKMKRRRGNLNLNQVLEMLLSGKRHKFVSDHTEFIFDVDKKTVQWITQDQETWGMSSRTEKIDFDNFQENMNKILNSLFLSYKLCHNLDPNVKPKFEIWRAYK